MIVTQNPANPADFEKINYKSKYSYVVPIQQANIICPGRLEIFI